MKQLIKISQVKSNPNNPRLIKNDKFKKLVKSVQDFPEMLELRPIVVDENMIVLGGNMRLKACIEAGLKEVWIEVAEGLTEEQKKEFIVKDNVGFGEWEWDMLANEWDSVQLAEWGLDVWQNEDDIEDIEEVIDFNEDVNFIIKCEN
jgi:ParB-like chromosome segregation protein Spo0J